MNARMLRISSKAHPTTGIQPKTTPQMARIAEVFNFETPDSASLSSADFSLPKATRYIMIPAQQTIRVHNVFSI